MPVVAANQLLVQVDGTGGVPDTIILTIGQAAPPPVAGTPEQQMKEIAERYATVPVLGIARVTLTPARLREWVTIMDGTLKRIEAIDQQGEKP